MNKRDKLISQAAANELAKRLAIKDKGHDVLKLCIPAQLDFIQDEAKRKAYFGTRRSGKSTGAALYAFHIALTKPKSKIAYIGLSNQQAKKTMWYDVFESIVVRNDLNEVFHFKETALEIHCENDSIIYLTGADATPHQKERLRGQKYALAIVDECQSFTQDLDALINNILGPTVAQSNATICALGTPGNLIDEKHYWYRITKPDSVATDWKLFKASWQDNTSVDGEGGRVCDNIKAFLNDRIDKQPLWTKTPGYRQEWLGEWVPETSARTYKSEDHNYIQELPSEIFPPFTRAAKGTHYVLGCDLGYYDATAFLICAYNNKFSPNLYVIESFKKTHLTYPQVHDIIRGFDQKYKLTHMIVDAAVVQGVETMKEMSGLPLQAADKHGKEAHIHALNSDFITDNVLIYEPGNLELIKELQFLIWDQKVLDKTGKRKEDGRKENHLTDALLYAHHDSCSYWYNPDVAAATKSEEEKLYDHLMKRNRDIRYLSKPWWEN
jgi:hypothetical protein